MPSPILKQLALCALGVLLAAPAAGQDVSYDTFAQLPRDEQVRVFASLSPESRADLARTQAARWLAWNRDRLTEEQVVLVEETIALVRPALYDEANRQAEQVELAVLFERLQEAFPRSDLAEWVGEGAPHIPAPPEEPR